FIIFGVAVFWEPSWWVWPCICRCMWAWVGEACRVACKETRARCPCGPGPWAGAKNTPALFQHEAARVPAAQRRSPWLIYNGKLGSTAICRTFFMKILRFSDLCAQGKARGQRVFIRADLNVPLDDQGRITEDTRI